MGTGCRRHGCGLPGLTQGFFLCIMYSSLGPFSASTPLLVLHCHRPLGPLQPSHHRQPIHRYQPMQLTPVVACPSPSHFLPSSFKFINRRQAALHELAWLIGHPKHLAAFASLLALQLQLLIQTYSKSLYLMSLSILTDGVPLWAVALFFEAWISQIPRSPTPHLPWSATCRCTWVLSDVPLCSAFTTPSESLKPQIPVTASCLLISHSQLAESSYSVMSLRESEDWDMMDVTRS